MINVFKLESIFSLQNGKKTSSLEQDLFLFSFSRFLETLVQYRIQPFQEYQISP